MKYDQFCITAIELTHDQAEQLKIDCINAIENYGIENFEVKRTEITVTGESEQEPIDVYISCETFSIFDDEAAPFEPTLLERSVQLKIELYNEHGMPVKYSVSGRLEFDVKNDRFMRYPAIDIEEEIIKHFTV